MAPVPRARRRARHWSACSEEGPPDGHRAAARRLRAQPSGSSPARGSRNAAGPSLFAVGVSGLVPPNSSRSRARALLGVVLDDCHPCRGEDQTYVPGVSPGAPHSRRVLRVRIGLELLPALALRGLSREANEPPADLAVAAGVVGEQSAAVVHASAPSSRSGRPTRSYSGLYTRPQNGQTGSRNDTNVPVGVAPARLGGPCPQGHSQWHACSFTRPPENAAAPCDSVAPGRRAR